MANPTTREELYKRIRETSKGEVVLEEMIRLGFWPAGKDIPKGPLEDIRRAGELEREFTSVRTELSRLENREAMLKALRKKHMLEARERRAQTKKKREEERVKRAEAWKEAKTRDISYLGAGVSFGLQYKEGDALRLASFNLPAFGTAAELAQAMKMEVGELRFLSFSRLVSRTTHYRRFYIPKKTGGQRLISAPMPRLKEAQNWVLENILQKIPVHEAAHGFLLHRSIVSNANPHIGQDVVVNLDLKDFFPCIAYPRVKGLFRSFGYSEQVGTILALLCTEPEVDEVELDKEIYYVQQGQRHVPQGAPSSPMITNIICRRLDKRLAKLAASLGFVYTRYADDLTFSCGPENTQNVGKLLHKIRSIVTHEGFALHPDKTRVLHKGRKQEVTGLVVNKTVAVDRKMLRKLRAALFQMEKDGITGKWWGHSPDVLASVQGYAYFVYMVNPTKGAALLERIRGIKERVRYTVPMHKRYPKHIPSWIERKEREKQAALLAKQQQVGTSTAPLATPSAQTPQETKKPWWKFW